MVKGDYITSDRIKQLEARGEIQFMSIMTASKTTAFDVFLNPELVDLFELHWFARGVTYELHATATDKWELVKLRDRCLDAPVTQAIDWSGNGYNNAVRYGHTDTRHRSGARTRQQWHRDIRNWRQSVR